MSDKPPHNFASWGRDSLRQMACMYPKCKHLLLCGEPGDGGRCVNPLNRVQTLSLIDGKVSGYVSPGVAPTGGCDLHET